MIAFYSVAGMDCYFVLADQYDPNDAERCQQRSPASLQRWISAGAFPHSS
jgi:hypothetical protein